MASKTSTNTSAMDSRKELSELIKRKAEISVSRSLFTFFFGFYVTFCRPISRVSKGRFSPLKDHIWRTLNCMETSFEAGIAIWQPTRVQIPKRTSGTVSSKTTSDCSASQASLHRWGTRLQLIRRYSTRKLFLGCCQWNPARTIKSKRLEWGRRQSVVGSGIFEYPSLRLEQQSETRKQVFVIPWQR